MPLVPIIYAHRGGAALRPENTIEAFDHGLACGADGIEFDVHLSRDDEVVIHHDATLERTTSGRGPVRSRTADELAGIDAAFNFRNDSGGFPFRGRGIGVPTLPEVLRRYPSALLIIELKVDGDHLARRVVEEVRAADAVGRVAIGSFFPRALQTVRDLEPAIATGAAKEETRWALYRSWIGLGIGATPYQEFQVPERSGRTTIVTRRFVAAAHRAGIPVKVWTVNGVEDMRRLAGLGVDALITDRPDRARALVGDEPHGDAPGAHSRARR